VAKCCGGNLLELGRQALLQDGGKRGVVSPENYVGVGAAMQWSLFPASIAIKGSGHFV